MTFRSSERFGMPGSSEESERPIVWIAARRWRFHARTLASRLGVVQ